MRTVKDLVRALFPSVNAGSSVGGLVTSDVTIGNAPKT